MERKIKLQLGITYNIQIYNWIDHKIIMNKINLKHKYAFCQTSFII